MWIESRFLKLVWYNEWMQTDIHYTFTLRAISAINNIIIVLFCKGNHEVVKVKVWSYTLQSANVIILIVLTACCGGTV